MSQKVPKDIQSKSASSSGSRELIKTGSLLGAALGLAGAAWAGYRAGKDYRSYTGWENNHEGGSQFFNRKPFEIAGLPYEQVGPLSRIDQRVDIVVFRDTVLGKLMHVPYYELHGPLPSGPPEWTEADGIEKLPEPWRSYYQANPKIFEVDLYRMRTLWLEQIENTKRFDKQFAITNAFATANAMTFAYPPEPNAPPEIADFQGVRPDPLRFKSPEHAAQLIKKMAHLFGATLVGVTKLNPNWVWGYDVRGGKPGPFEVPAWWEYAIAIGVPMEWDSFYSNPTYGTSYDGYSRTRMAGFRLQNFLRLLGYPARMHVPPFSYELSAPPVAIDAGLGQQGRMGLVITPELGPNVRWGVITTSLPMAVDKPIDFGVREFCNKCKICANSCPTGAISFDDEPTQIRRGVRKWVCDTEACFSFWATKMGPGGCRLCVSVCPYSRKNNWLHSSARTLAAYDRTHIADSLMLEMQKRFFDMPSPTDYYPPPIGTNASYRQPPDWLLSEKWFDLP